MTGGMTNLNFLRRFQHGLKAQLYHERQDGVGGLLSDAAVPVLEPGVQIRQRVLQLRRQLLHVGQLLGQPPEQLQQ